jgi:hypothetical protein
MNEYKEIFVDSRGERYNKSILEESELNFFIEKGLIKEYGQSFKTNFVGEIITPNNKYFSLPKRFEATEENILLFKEVLNKYAIINGKSLLENNTFIINPSGKVESEKFYYKELKGFFLDYITYEFIYPKKRIKKHSTAPISGGKIDIASTDRFRDQKGPGVTYNVKDFKNSDDWRLDDIYWSTISYLADKYNDRREIDEMFNFLEVEGFDIKGIDISDSDKILKEIESCEVGIIHNPIKETLISYFKSKSVDTTKFKIKVFYTDNFAKVWEEMVRSALKENKEFREDYVKPGKPFYSKITKGRWFPNKEMGHEYISDKNWKEIEAKPRGSGVYINWEQNIYSDPDVFSEYLNKRIIGDAKYYNKPEESEFEKEWITYNILSNNKYPMIILYPGDRTFPVDDRRKTLTEYEKEFELILFQLSIKEVIEDAVKGSNITIDKIHMFLWSKGWTNREPTDGKL